MTNSSKLLLCVLLVGVAQALSAEPWKRHTIDRSSRGADGVRLADINGDGRLDIVSPWEEGGVVRVYLQPIRAKVKNLWPQVQVGKVRSPEDALLVDLDGDGVLDVLSCCEGRSRTIYVHWAPKKSQLLDSSKWVTQPIPCTQKKQSWMFAVNVGRKQPLLVVGSKGKNAAVGLLQPRARRNVSNWTYRKLISAGWIMSLIAHDLDNDGDLDVIFSDRKGKRRGVYWLQNKGRGETWKTKLVGGTNLEVMFLDQADLDGDGRIDILCPTRNRKFVFYRNTGKGWQPNYIANPYGLRNGKAIAVGDIDGDGKQDLVHTANTGGNRMHHGVCWLSYRRSPTEKKWQVHTISGRRGVKFDLVKLLDVDGDGDLDVLTCEERDNLGVFWYENPRK